MDDEPKTTITLDDNKLPPAMAAYGKRERVAEIIFDWIHKGQVTHRRKYDAIPEDQKEQYRAVAKDIEAVYQRGEKE